ncbi:MAG: redox-sensing transcriptional repressor Rex [Christensenellales bacterium]
MNKKVSDAVIRRLPRYYRYLKELERIGVEKISSRELSECMGLNASQIRQDFNCFGGFGQQGFGYYVKVLRKEIEAILGLNTEYKAIIIGIGNIGQALAGYKNFIRDGFRIVAAFDVNHTLVGNTIKDIRIYPMSDMKDYLKENNIHLAIICTPEAAAQQVADELSKAGVDGIWNFAPIDVHVDGICVENVHLSDSLFTLTYKMREADQAGVY